VRGSDSSVWPLSGIPIPLGDNRLLKARFEKYLSQPPENDKETVRYRATIAEILGTISPFRRGGPDLYSAFRRTLQIISDGGRPPPQRTQNGGPLRVRR